MLDDPFNIDDLHEEDLITIDLDAINSDSEKEAKDIIKIVTDLYQDDLFKERHPQVQRRIELELETLRGLIKMRKADEEAHDALILAITENKIMPHYIGQCRRFKRPQSNSQIKSTTQSKNSIQSARVSNSNLNLMVQNKMMKICLKHEQLIEVPNHLLRICWSLQKRTEPVRLIHSSISRINAP